MSGRGLETHAGPRADAAPLPAKRDHRIDAIRGIGILLVVLGHVWTSPYLLQKTIYAFHMPLFFILSGYLFNEEKRSRQSFPAFLREKALRLYLPAVLIGLSCAIPSILAGHTDSLPLFLVRVFGVIYGIPNSTLTFNCTPIWFLSCLLSLEVIYFLLCRQVGRRMRLPVVAGCFLLGWWSANLKGYYFPLNLNVALSVLPFFHFGKCLAERRFLADQRFRMLPVLLAACTLAAAVHWAPVKVNLADNTLGPLPQFFAGSLAGSHLVLALATLARNLRVLVFFGNNTIFILGYNYLVYEICERVAARVNAASWAHIFVAELLVFAAGIYLLRYFPAINALLGGSQVASRKALPG